MTRVVIDASAGAEIVTATARGRALARLLPNDAELWVPEHFYVEVLGVLRHQSVIARTIGPDRADLAADAVYVALAEQFGAFLLTDDHRLIRTPSFPSGVTVLQLPLR